MRELRTVLVGELPDVHGAEVAVSQVSAQQHGFLHDILVVDALGFQVLIESKVVTCVGEHERPSRVVVLVIFSGNVREPIACGVVR